MKKRFLLIGVISEEKDSLFSLLTGIDNQYSLSDQQMKDIESRLIVKNVEEYISKFGTQISTYSVEDEQSDDKYLDTFKRDLLKKRDIFDVFYSEKVHENKRNDGVVAGNKMYFEVLEGLKMFFRQRQDDSEILILNVGISYGFTEQEQNLIRLYFETANTKLDNQYKIDAILVPGLYFPKNTGKNIRQRFMGTTEEDRYYVEYDQILTLSKLLEKYEIPVLIQYECLEESGPKGFAESGQKYFKQGCDSLVENGVGDHVMICFPNLSSTNPKIYIGAAFAVAALAGEDGSAIPRELYPYTETAKEDIRRADFGAMLCYSKDRMSLACHYSLRGNNLDV